MCNFELAPDQFRERRVAMIALADERRLARAMKPARARSRRWVRVPQAGPRPSPVPNPARLLSPAPLFR